MYTGPITPFPLSLALTLCVFVFVCIIQRTIFWTCIFFPLYHEYSRIKLAPQAYQQVYLPAKPSYWSTVDFLDNRDASPWYHNMQVLNKNGVGEIHKYIDENCKK